MQMVTDSIDLATLKQMSEKMFGGLVKEIVLKLVRA
jgi:hypothetical protein